MKCENSCDPWLLVLDLDGTTCNSQRRMTAGTRQALRRARQAGHLVCFATGRRNIDMTPLGDVSDCADYLALNNGSKLVRTCDRAELYNHYIPADVARIVVSFCLEHHYLLHVLSGEDWAVNGWSEGLQEYADQLGCSPRHFDRLDQVPIDQVEGFTVTVDRYPVCAFIEQQGLPLDYTLSEDSCVDIMAVGNSKWNSVCNLLSLLKGTHRIAAAGDYDNDLEMIRNADLGIAVGNAQDCVKAAADVIVPDNDHEAVKYIVEQFIL